MAIDLSRFIATFFDEAQEHLESIEEMAMALGSGRQDPEVLNSIFRAAHSIKGGSGTFGFTQLADATHEMETLFDALRKGRGVADETTVRLLLDRAMRSGAPGAPQGGGRATVPAMSHAGQARATCHRASAIRRARPALQAPTEESFFTLRGAPARPPKRRRRPTGFDDEPAASGPGRGQPAEARRHPGARTSDQAGEQNRRRRFLYPRGVEEDPRIEPRGRARDRAGDDYSATSPRRLGEDEHLAHSLATLDRNTRDLQQAVMSIRMLPMEFVFSRFPRLAYDVSTRLGKKVHLRTQGNETELDKELIELLIDPLTHVVRNSIDHGIESPEERRKAGKPEMGTVLMRATHRGGSVIIEVSDDGRGLDRERIIAKARELGMPVDESMSDKQVWAFVFEAGFSTAREVTNLSGRGVGMDVVRRNITSLGGMVSVSSAKGEGTTITIQLPLTLAVLDGMIVGVGEEQYIVPLEFVAEAFKPAAADIRTVVNQASLVAVRGEHLPRSLRTWSACQLQARRSARTPLPGGEVDNRRAAFLVDSLIGQQLVVKSLESNLHCVPGVAGATILGDGRVALILDVNSVVRMNASHPLARSAA